MTPGIAPLIVAYILSQFFRAFLAVLSPALQADLGMTPDDLARASGLWFLTFAAMQIPVGAALDRYGPRRTAVILFALFGGGGAVAFAMAQTPLHVMAAMGLIGIGCSPILMAAYVIFARAFPPAQFATLAAGIIGIGSLGNIAGSAPLAWAADAWGWRATMAGLGGITVATALALWAFLRDPPAMTDAPSGSVLDVIRMRALWPILAMMFVCYAPAAGLRALWAGPYARDVFGADAGGIGTMTLIMGLAMVAGNFAYGPLDRLFASRKGVILTGNGIVMLACLALWARPDAGFWAATALFALIGFAGASFGVVIAHGRAFIPAHLTGRGVTLLNLAGIAGAGIGQFVTARLHAGSASTPASAPYAAIFLYFGLTTLVGLLAYLAARDRPD